MTDLGAEDIEITYDGELFCYHLVKFFETREQVEALKKKILEALK